jgi:hypothetical protein
VIVRALWLLLVLLLLPSSAGGESPPSVRNKPVEAIPPGGDRIELLLEGKPAPFTGQLFDNATSMRWANWLVQYKYRLTIDVQEQKDLCAVQTEALQRQLVIESDKYAKVTTAYDQKLAEVITAAEPSWYETPWIGFVSGVILTTAAAGVIVWAANSGSN